MTKRTGETATPTAKNVQPTRSAIRQRPVLWLTILVVIGVVSILAWPRIAQRPETLTPATAVVSQPAKDYVAVDAKQLPQISVAAVQESRIAVDRNATGRIAFNEDRLTPVFTPYAGRVVELLVNKGDEVRAGQPLMVLESPDFVAAQNDLASARSDVAKANIELSTARTTVERSRRLYDQEAIAGKDVQQAEADLARAQDEFHRAEMARTTVEHRLSLFGKDPQEIADLADHVDRQVIMRAPIAGTIVDRKVGPGQYVKPDAPDPLFLISDLTTLWALADIYESDTAAIHLDMPVEVRVAAYPERDFPARISFISPTVDSTTRTVRVRCLVPNVGGLLKPDMFATLRIGSPVQQSVPIVPASAVVVEGNTSLVFVSTGSGHFRKRQIEVGQEMGGGFAVDSGLRAGELVATRGSLLLNELSKSSQ